MNSLRQRLTLLSVAILAACALVLGLVAERTLRASLLESQRSKMQGIVYAILGATDLDGEGRFVVEAPERLDARLADPASTLHASIQAEDGRVLWASPGSSISPLQTQPGAWSFVPADLGSEDPTFTMAYGVTWREGNRSTRFAVQIEEDGHAFGAQLRKFRATLLRWILGLGLLLILLEFAILRLGFRPLSTVARQLSLIQRGERDQIDAKVPDELAVVRDGMNAVLRHERAQQKRYRHALDDLAHSLKTPLAVLKASDPEEAREQIDRIDDIIRVQLQRAAAAGRNPFAPPIRPAEQAQKLGAALGKAFAEKGIAFDNRVDPDTTLRMDASDFLEIAGNLLENAFKYGSRRVRMDGREDSTHHHFVVEDDGPGFSQNPDRLLTRGVRGDTRVEGQGIGLAMVDDLVRIYEGRIALDRSPELAGARVTVSLPK